MFLLGPILGPGRWPNLVWGNKMQNLHIFTGDLDQPPKTNMTYTP